MLLLILCCLWTSPILLYKFRQPWGSNKWFIQDTSVVSLQFSPFYVFPIQQCWLIRRTSMPYGTQKYASFLNHTGWCQVKKICGPQMSQTFLPELTNVYKTMCAFPLLFPLLFLLHIDSFSFWKDSEGLNSTARPFTSTEFCEWITPAHSHFRIIRLLLYEQ